MLKHEGEQLLEGKPSPKKPPKPPPRLSFKQKLRRKERRDAEEARLAQMSPALRDAEDSPLSSPEEYFGTSITGDEIRRIQQDGGSVLASCDSPRLRSKECDDSFAA